MDEREFEKVFWELQPQLVRHARHHLDADAAEDAAAETLLTLWRKQLDFPADAVAARQLRALAFQVLLGVVRNEHRSRRRRRDLRGAIHAQVVVIGEQSLDVAVSSASRSAIDHWLGQLPPAERDVMLLVNAGFTVGEVAQVLGCTDAAVAKRRTRAKKRLRELLLQERGGGRA